MVISAVVEGHYYTKIKLKQYCPVIEIVIAGQTFYSAKKSQNPVCQEKKMLKMTKNPS